MQELSTRMAQAHKLLSPYAIPHTAPLSREHEEQQDATRFPFQRDRDRIIHALAFRRLKHKTQVFVAGKGDHYRTRLTHTMEVAQISRDMARTLGLNEDLAECIALAHDLGHTPFGHAGEDAMNEQMQRFDKGFEHNLQSLRVVTLLEQRSTRYKGLNLNREVLEGLMKHRTAFDQSHGAHISRSPSLEAQIVNLADEIAYSAHDTDDGLRSGILSEDALRSATPLFEDAAQQAKHQDTEARGSLIDLLVMDAYAETERRLVANKITSLAQVYSAQEDLVAFSPRMQKRLAKLRSFLQQQFYNSKDVLLHSQEGKHIIAHLFEAYGHNPPEKVLELQQRTGSTLHEAIKDYIAGMTDQFASICVQDLRSAS